MPKRMCMPPHAQPVAVAHKTMHACLGCRLRAISENGSFVHAHKKLSMCMLAHAHINCLHAWFINLMQLMQNTMKFN